MDGLTMLFVYRSIESNWNSQQAFTYTNAATNWNSEEVFIHTNAPGMIPLFVDQLRTS